MRRTPSRLFLLVALATVAALATPVSTIAAPTSGTVSSGAPDAAPDQVAVAGGFLHYLEIDSPVCVAGSGFNVSNGPYFVTTDCGFSVFTLSGVPDGATLSGELVDADGNAEAITVTGPDTEGEGRARYDFTESTPIGELTLRILVNGEEAGRSRVFHNVLQATVAVDGAVADDLEAGDDIPVEGTIEQLDANSSDLVPPSRTGVPAEFALQVRLPDGTVTPVAGTTTANGDGTFSATIPGAATAGVTPSGNALFTTIGIDVVDATYDDGGTPWAAAIAGSTAAQLLSPPSTLLLDNSFVSSVGWVKPGDDFPFTVTVSNATGAPVTGAAVVIDAPPAVTFTSAQALDGAPGAVVLPSQITWPVGTVPAGTPLEPALVQLVVEAQAATLVDDPEVVWKDLSVAAQLTADDGTDTTSLTHGPKVIPPTGGFESARYGDKPFPIVPVDYTDRYHEDSHAASGLDRVINDTTFEGSMINLYQEMSYGQIFPEGAIPSADIAVADFDYEPGFDFTTPRPGPCRGTTMASFGADAYGSPLYPDRIVEGWYRLPGDTEYYGGDFPAFTLGVGSTIDAACGDTGKSVYDAAVIADPEINYDEFDSDKDGVVDFFMLVFVGLGGNGDSQINGAPPYDNIWPHSSSLENGFVDPTTGLRGYTSDDQLTSLTGVPQCWTDATYSTYTDCAADGGAGRDDLPTFVRVGPYNVNPEEVFESASVISHEYGHHLGLPDFYSGGATSSPYYDSMNLMASDYSQHMTIFGKQDLGWVVPRVVQPGDTVTVDDWAEIKTNIGEIDWVTPDGTPYTLSAANGDQYVRNGEAYTVKLPQERVIDPAVVDAGASAPNVFWSGRGNDFGCSPTGGHNMDLFLPELGAVDPGSTVTLTFQSSWDIEWDWDYGFVLTSTDGQTYTSHPSGNGYSTSSAYNPNSAGCLDELDNGLTGQSGAWLAGEPFITAARNPAENDYSYGAPFTEDTYDLSSLAGEDGARVRFSYFTDTGFDRPGWFIDDIVVSVDGEPIVEIDGDDPTNGRLFQGGCDDSVQIAAPCTNGWNLIDTDAASSADHGYYLELRDRSLFDYEGRGQSSRGTPDWQPGIFIEYTNEVHGYGNNGVPPPPSQHYLDSVPEPGLGCDLTSCEDSAFQDAVGRNHFDDDPDDADGEWIDNHADEQSDDGLWHFAYGCLTLDVTDMAGTDAALATNLTASATIQAGDGCRIFTYEPPTEDEVNTPPIPKITYSPSDPDVDEAITFDATGSTDEQDPIGALDFAWDLDGDGQFDDATSQTVTTSYATPGVLNVGLRVTDSGGLSADVRSRVEIGEGGTTEPPTPTTDRVERIYGNTRIDTAIALSVRGHDSAESAVLARADDFPDALAAAPLAAELDGPVLLTGRDDLHPDVADELRRLGVETVYLVGGEGALSSRVAAGLGGLGLRVVRLGGADRFETAALIADEVVDLGGSVDGAIVAIGIHPTRDAFPDALAASQLAIAERRPVLLVGQDRLPDSTSAALDRLLADGDSVVIAGGAAAVSEDVEAAIAAKGLDTSRLAGATRYETATRFADAAMEAGVPGTSAWVASGANFPDALAAGPVVAGEGGILLLTPKDDLIAATRAWLEAHATPVSLGIIVGGPGAIVPAVNDLVLDAIS